MIITEIQYFSSKIIRFQAIFKDTVEFTCALEFKISSQLFFIFLQFHKKSLIASSFPGDLIQLGKSQSFRKVQGYFVLWHH